MLVVKRNGDIVDFDLQKVYEAIKKAVVACGGTDFDRVSWLVNEVVKQVEKRHEEPTVENIQDIVESVLMNNGHTKTAKAYILYRQKRKEIRDERSKILDGLVSELKLPLNSLVLLKERYLRRTNGNNKETPEELFRRVAKFVAKADEAFGENIEECEEKFYKLMSEFYFLPNSPTLMNAGTKHPQLLSVYSLPITDSVEGIFDAIKKQAIVIKSGGGTGFNFSKIRPKGNKVRGLNNVASGPVEFIKLYDNVAESILQSGRRKAANMGILRVDHPDILQFITQKQDGKLNNFNISVGLTEKFMDAVEKNSDFSLINPRTKEIVQKISARHIFDLLILSAWKTGDPGILFLDRINFTRSNPLLGVEQIESTSPCGEQPLYQYEGCILGSINISKLCKSKEIDWNHLKEIVRDAVHFLDNALDVTDYPLNECAIKCRQNRRIGLGVMGFADLLFQLEIPYDSDEAIEMARAIMRFISKNADEASRELANLRGEFPNFNRSVYGHGYKLRNASRTTISPTGSISIIADCSASIEPIFALSYVRRFVDKEMIVINPHFEIIAQRRGFYNEEIMKRVAQNVSIQNIPEVPEHVKKIYKVAFDISPTWQLRMQAAFQEFTDNAISKTINFPSWATTKDVEEVFFLAYKLGCKGITIYRDKSKENQVIKVNIETATIQDSEEVFFCPECNETMQEKENIHTCTKCGFSRSKL
ncbi:adenosylcobalamin-dependent ribonucleoside-diphosphate reductase [Nanoarchaeota archaeon]